MKVLELNQMENVVGGTDCDIAGVVIGAMGWLAGTVFLAAAAASGPIGWVAIGAWVTSHVLGGAGIVNACT